MASIEVIENPADMESLLRMLVEDAIAGNHELAARSLAGARVLWPGATQNPSFVIKLAGGREFEVEVKELSSPHSHTA